MKTVLVLASLAASAFAQAIHILQPTSGAAIKAGSPFTLEIQQEGSLQRISQGTVTVSAGGQVIYSGPFNPLFHSAAPAKGMYQDYYLTMPNVPHAGKGLVVLDVQHDFSVPNAANQPQAAHNSASTIVRIV